MTRVVFVDRDGVTGVIDSELLVEYDGDRNEIVSYVNEVRDDHQPPEEAPKEVMQDLVIELPQECPVQEARFCDGGDP